MTMPRTATIGPAVYQRVNELVAEGKTRTEAFAQVGQERRQQPGTVAANFYRTARSQGATKPRQGRRAKSTRRAVTTARKPQARRAPTRASARQAAAPNGDLSALAAQIGDLVQQLVRQVEERDRRLREVLG
jgi:hypothetical protein